MITTDRQPELTAEEFHLFRDFIHEKAGMFFADNKMYLIKNRLTKRIGELGINSFKDYFYRVKYDVTMKEFNNLMNLVTTNETSFFRNPPQLKSFAEEALPLIIKEKVENKKPKTIKIWSAGCSTGEEPYTLAMIILEHFYGNLAGWNIEIVATDISEEVLGAARKGYHHELSLRTTPGHIVPKYFDREGNKYKIKPIIKNMVRFGYLNLNDTRKLSMYSNMDFIFCRNVMIYFSEDVKRQLVRGFYNSLRPGGYFYIGHSESLHGISKAFKLVYFKNALVYHKEEVGSSSDTKTSSLSKYKTTVGASSGAGKAMELLKKIKPMTTT
ncbi:MAG: protein-glutamate O-methyltransferase CheR [candidate division Zixibacteria bacterium]|nr:protein-glutamate O-methyltransferase CheR [candidate division Zixibacteria bacterium]